MSNAKKSLIAGGLLSSAGILISKILGILYVVPFQALVGSENMQYYSYAFDIYTYVLNISIAGLPFAIATLVSMYASKGDYKTTLLIKKLSLGIMLMLGFLGMSLVIAFSKPLAILISPEMVSAQSLQITQNVLVIISLALFFVPILSSYRGFYQGFQEMGLYANNQVLEQLSRILFLLGFGALAVIVMKQDQIWAVYVAVFATSFSALIALGQFLIIDRKKIKNIKIQAQRQEAVQASRKKIVKELLKLAIPYLLVSVLGEIYRMVDLVTMNKSLEAYGYSAELAGTVLGMYKFNVGKLTSIPMIFANGFSIAIIPFITKAIALKEFDKVRRSIREVLDSVMYLVLPLAFALFIFATPIYFVMYGNETLQMSSTVTTTTAILGGGILAWGALEALIGTIAPIVSYLLMSLKFTKTNLKILVIGAIIKIALTVPLTQMFGYSGTILSTVLAITTCIFLGLYVVTVKYKVDWKPSIRRYFHMSMGLLGMFLVAATLQAFGWYDLESSRAIIFLQLAFSGVLAILVYYAITHYYKLPQRILHFDLVDVVSRLRRRIK